MCTLYTVVVLSFLRFFSDHWPPLFTVCWLCVCVLYKVFVFFKFFFFCLWSQHYFLPPLTHKTVHLIDTNNSNYYYLQQCLQCSPFCATILLLFTYIHYWNLNRYPPSGSTKFEVVGWGDFACQQKVKMLETIPPPLRSLKRSEGTFDDDVILRRSGSSRNLSSNRSSRDRSSHSKPKSAAATTANRHSLFAPLTGATKLGSSLRSLSPFRHRGERSRRSSFTEHVSSSSSSSKCIIFACYLGFLGFGFGVFCSVLMFVRGPPWWCSGRQKMPVIFCAFVPMF